jgi:precorrin-2 dehydrogenase/sirohydrochlorin ferrochelatase
LSRHSYPILLDLTGRRVVIVGGGVVAVRKAAGVLDAGADRVRCVSPTFHPDLPTAVERVPEGYRPEHLEGAGLVFAATDSAEVNNAVVHDARARGIWVNRADADDAQPGDFTVPARLREGTVTVTVSAGGSPALAAAIRDGLAARWDPRWTAMAEAMQTLRPMVLSANLIGSRRSEILRELASDEALDVLKSGGADRLTQWLRERHPDLSHQTSHPQDSNHRS